MRGRQKRVLAAVAISSRTRNAAPAAAPSAGTDGGAGLAR
jgi:hypothetical protein